MGVTCRIASHVLLGSLIAVSVGASQQRFDRPQVSGVSLDWCLEWGQKCGKPAADEFCRTHELESARAFEKQSGVGRSIVLGTGQACRGPSCDGFAWIECATASGLRMVPPGAILSPRAPASPPPNARRDPGRAPVVAAPNDSVGNAFAREGALLSLSEPDRLSTSGEAFVDPSWNDEVVRFAWDVRKIGIAKAVVWQVARQPYPAAGDDLSQELRASALATAFGPNSKGEFTVDFKELNRQRLTIRGRESTFYVRVIPVASVETKTTQALVVGKPSNVIVVRRGEISCRERPEACCPGGDLCKDLVQTLIEVELRSYVPPRFTVMGDHRPIGPNASLANIVSDVSLGSPYPVRPGCRFSPTAAKNAIRDDMNVLEQGLDLATAMLHQWSSGYQAAKAFVADKVAVGVCEIVDDSDSCRDKVSSVVETGINVGLASLGIPPELPDLQQLRDHGVEYLAAQAASYAVGEADEILKGTGMDDALREQLYERAYQETAKAFREQLDKAIPRVAEPEADNPFTWGHMEPAYLPHNAHIYLSVRIKSGAAAAYRRLLGKRGASLRWPLLYIRDKNGVYGDPLPIRLPAFVPNEGLVLPIEIRPSFYPTNGGDTASAQIPNTPISKEWLSSKFGLEGNLISSQYNYRPFVNDLYINSDYDLFYATNGAYAFEVRSVFKDGELLWEEDIRHPPGTVWDRDTGRGTRTGPHWERGNQMKNYLGRIDPAPRCDGRSTKASYQ